MLILEPCVHSDHPATRDADPQNAIVLPPDHPDWSLPSTAPKDGTTSSITEVPPTESAYAIDIFGKSAGVLVANGGHFVFRAADSDVLGPGSSLLRVHRRGREGRFMWSGCGINIAVGSALASAGAVSNGGSPH